MELELLIPISFIVAVAAVAITSVRSRAATKRLLIENGMMNADYTSVLDAEARIARWRALRWGLVLAGLGTALIAADTLVHDALSPAGVGLVVLGAALGYIVYFFASKPAPTTGGA